MDLCEHKSVITRRGFTLSYYVSKPNNAGPTLLLQHGFPDDARLWDGIVKHLSLYHLIIPDLLGYSDTSKPTDPTAYNYVDHTGDIVEILDAENVNKVVSVGHDFGAIIAQRLYIHHPHRVEGLILLSLGYVLPSASPPNLEKANAQFEAAFGYPAFAYHEFLLSDDAPALLRANVDRFYYAMHGAPRDWMKQIWCTRGAMSKWLRDRDWQVELRSYAQDPALRRTFEERFQRDGFEGPLCYYKAMYSSMQYDTTKDLDKDRFVVRVPTCHVTCTQDPICRPELSIAAKNGGFLPDLEEHTVDSGHWIPLEKPEGVAKLMDSFLQRRFLA
ncbi:hypothetical protein JX265_010049 [Neoarthrinium moseri]|uniref:AB hydrolase-1 domain-containing protein n=1 Tax=Neoarthrinium moseri TaxID=1658444 RepID=A0A9Q0AIQ5_9PEZI|nr:hypothetical protein JX265_010049 [Neoarthrinium moseri]